MKIDGYDYEIDEVGKIISIRTGKIIKPYIANGYQKVDLYKESKRKKVYVHQLMGATYHKDTWFIGAIINHKNGNRLDNSIDNLEWSTYSKNNKHAYEVLGRVCPPRAKRGKSVHAVRISQISITTGDVIREFECIKDAVEKFGTGVEKCIYGTRKTANGFKWVRV